jgi:hypothetical protein
MGKRCLIIYSSYTGNTEKVALRFRSTFERNGWACDVFKIGKKAQDILTPPFDPDDYDFLCAGSGIRVHLPYNEILNVLRRLRLGMDPRIALRNRDETIPYIKEPLPDFPPPLQDPDVMRHHHKIVLGPDSKKAVVFATYAGYEFGPPEAAPSLQLLALEIEHLRFKCIGQFCCPGKFVDGPTPGTFHGDIRDRPNEKDLLKAEMFIEEKLEEITDRPAAG